MGPIRSCKTVPVSYVENISDFEEVSTDPEYADNESSSAEPMSTPTRSYSCSSISFDQIFRDKKLATLPQFDGDIDINDVPIENMIGIFIDFHYSLTGRFDQHEIDADHPLPTAPKPLERLGIAATMITYFREFPASIKEIDPRNLEKRKPFADGVPWCQYENACLVEEMCLWARTRGDSKIGGQTLMGKMADILNVKYGIGRSGTATKNQWYRFLRDRTGIDERGNFGRSSTSTRHGGPLAVSIGGTRKGKGVASGRITKKKVIVKRNPA